LRVESGEPSPKQTNQAARNREVERPTLRSVGKLPAKEPAVEGEG
jgi:hypothetical protein